LDLWTFKESYIKARGLGMSVPLDHFSINLTDLDKAPISFDGIEDLPDRWALYRLRPSGDHIMALCVERLRGAVPELVSRTVVPFSSDAILQSWVERIGAHFMKGEGDGLTHHIPGYNEPA
jgi:4'-phosphopantetheinyl transferase